MAGFFSDLLKGNLFHGKQILKAIQKNPEQLLLGAGDPLGAQLWSGITGKEYTPFVNQLGGPTEAQLDEMEAKGYNMDVIRPAYQTADTVAGLLGGYYGGQALGGAFSGGGAGSIEATGTPAITQSAPTAWDAYGMSGSGMVPSATTSPAGVSGATAAAPWYEKVLGNQFVQSYAQAAIPGLLSGGQKLPGITGGGGAPSLSQRGAERPRSPYETNQPTFVPKGIF